MTENQANQRAGGAQPREGMFCLSCHRLITLIEIKDGVACCPHCEEPLELGDVVDTTPAQDPVPDEDDFDAYQRDLRLSGEQTLDQVQERYDLRESAERGIRAERAGDPGVKVPVSEVRDKAAPVGEKCSHGVDSWYDPPCAICEPDLVGC